MPNGGCASPSHTVKITFIGSSCGYRTSTPRAAAPTSVATCRCRWPAFLAGDPEITVQVRHALLRDLADKLVDVIPASERDHQIDVVTATLSRFVEHEEQESRSVVEWLIV